MIGQTALARLKLLSPLAGQSPGEEQKQQEFLGVAAGLGCFLFWGALRGK